MTTKRWRLALLGALLIVLAFVVYRITATPGTASATAVTSNGSRAPTGPRNPVPAAPAAPDVRLDALNADRPAPADAQRNLFRFKTKAPALASGARPTAPATATTGPPPPPPGPPPPPPITLKFIGIVEQPGTKAKIAVLSDGLGPPMFGIEGGTVAGRYRVLRIGVESIELSYLDGRGRQTIRLTGG
jgi:hypothetical protein